MKFKAIWYNMDTVVTSEHDDEIIEAKDTEEATLNGVDISDAKSLFSKKMNGEFIIRCY